MDKKLEIINKIYEDLAGYGSKKETLADAREKDKTIKLEDVNVFFDKYVERKKQLKGWNSFIAQEAYEEFQVDLFFTSDWDEFDELGKQKFGVGLLMIDIFTKYITVIPIKSKSEGDVASGIIEGFNKMGGKPKSIYTDEEASFKSQAIGKYDDDNNIQHIITRTHAHFAERAIRTIKNMIVDRLEKSDVKQWSDLIFAVLLKYNNKNETLNNTHDT